MRILFVRHGESEANVQRIFANRGWSHPLTEKGRQQAADLAEKLAVEAPTAIYSSPLQRAVETGQIIADRCGLSLQIEPALIEYHVGVYEGAPLDADDAIARYAEVARIWAKGDIDARLPQGESCRDIQDRFVPFIGRLLNRFADSGATIVLVGHGGTFTHALPMILPNLTCAVTLANRLENASFAEARLRDGRLRCVRWGEQIID